VSAVEARTSAPARRRLKLAAGLLLIVAAIAWLFLEPFKGPILWDFGDHHGLDLGDLVAIPLFVLGLALLWPARDVRSPVRE
jgi:peptidoglycan/LPS O-acetylase OafA/YrhL